MKALRYTIVRTAEFVRRSNRFIANVILDDKEEIVHIKNTGRLKEILQQGAPVVLEESKNTGRKTKYSLIAAYKGDVLINIDSQVPNMVVYDGIKDGKVKEIHDVIKLRREAAYGNSRFDLYFETKAQRGFIEVKGVTLETEGVAMFPDAPTERGCKHIYELIKAVKEGYAGFIFFLIQLKGVKYFTPHEIRHPEFAKALKLAKEKGVAILAYDSIVSENDLIIGDPVEVRL